MSLTTHNPHAHSYAVWCFIIYSFLLLFWSYTPTGDEDDINHVNSNPTSYAVNHIDDDSSMHRELHDGMSPPPRPSVSRTHDSQSTHGVNNGDNNDGGGGAAALVDEAPLSGKTIYQQLVSFEFVFLVAFASIQMLRSTAYIGFNDEVLAHYGDDVTCNGWYVKKKNIVIICCFFFLFFVCEW